MFLHLPLEHKLLLTCGVWRAWINFINVFPDSVCALRLPDNLTFLGRLKSSSGLGSSHRACVCMPCLSVCVWISPSGRRITVTCVCNRLCYACKDLGFRPILENYGVLLRARDGAIMAWARLLLLWGRCCRCCCCRRCRQQCVCVCPRWRKLFFGCVCGESASFLTVASLTCKVRGSVGLVRVRVCV